MHVPLKFTVALIQMSVTTDGEENLKKGVSKIEEAARSGAQVVCLPELFRSQYFCQKEDIRYFDL
ncbi:MAG: nitrilase-related carbon-nitrogen hydrolase, partial [Nitrospinota bacterium]